MDRSWVNLPRTSSRYIVGVNHFLDFAFDRSSVNNNILCPCPKCKFKKWHPRDIVFEHLIVKQFPSKYTFWGIHGENDDDHDEEQAAATSQVGLMQIDDHEDHVEPIDDVVRDAFGAQRDNIGTEEGVDGPLPEFFRNEAARNFFDLMTEADKPLFPGSTKNCELSFIVVSHKTFVLD